MGRTAGLATALLFAACGEGPPKFPPADPTRQTTSASGDFAGAEACGDCHANQYAAWARSTHGRAGGAPTTETVLAPFDGQPIRFSDATARPRAADGRWYFEITWQGESWALDVAAVVGGGHMRGGGTQGFVTEWADGTVRFLPFDWSATGGFWFCNTNGRRDEGWRPIDEAMSLADCADWPPFRVLGSEARFQNCQGCHGSQIQVTRTDGGAYHTSWTSLRVECEACHGPATEHVDWAKAGGSTRDGAPGDNGIRSLGTLGVEGSLQVCDACHSLKGQLQEGHVTGAGDLAAYYSLGLAWLDGRPYTTDGRVASFAYQGTHRSSACYMGGAMRCTSCHEPHAGGYWDANRAPLPSPFDDGQCTACHASKAEDPGTHTRHTPDSDGSRCVSCHMPYVQHPAVGEAVPFARADHTVSSPTSEGGEGLPRDACSNCHGDWTRDEIDEAIRDGWGPLKPHRPLVEALRRGGMATEGVLRNDLYDPVAQLTLMARFAEESVRPGTPASPDVTEGLWALADSRDQDVRALALAVLHLTQGDRPAVIRQLSEALEPVSATEPLRRRWVAFLTYLGDRWRASGRPDDALSAYQAGLELLPEQVYLLQAVGVLLREDGRPWLERAVAADPDDPLTRVSLALFHQAAGSPEQALAVLEDAIERGPLEPVAHHMYGRVLAATDRPERARTALERAAELDWGSPDILRDLMTIQEALGDREAARATARRLVAFSPGQPDAIRVLGSAVPDE